MTSATPPKPRMPSPPSPVTTPALGPARDKGASSAEAPFTSRTPLSLGGMLLIGLILALWAGRGGVAAAPGEEPSSVYVGPTACGGCHPEILKSFLAYSGKAQTMSEVNRIRGLTPQETQRCLGCHTTGYGKPGGFKSAAETPELHNLGCEVCHGPGSNHVNSGGDPKTIIGKPTLKVCETCHDSTTVEPRRYRGILMKAH